MLSDEKLSNALVDIFNRMQSTPMSIKNYADELAVAIDEQIKTADVNAGIPVETKGSPTAQKGETVGVGTLS